MKPNISSIIFTIVLVSVAALAFLKPADAIKFSSFDEQVSYCAWKYQKYCEEWEYRNNFNPNTPPTGGFRSYAPECYQNGLDLNDKLDICLAYEDYEK